MGNYLASSITSRDAGCQGASAQSSYARRQGRPGMGDAAGMSRPRAPMSAPLGPCRSQRWAELSGSDDVERQSSRYQPPFAHGDEPTVTDDEVIQKLDVEELPGFGELAGDVHVVR